jgi:hypothetical protein
MEHQGFSSSLIKGIKTSLNKIKEWWHADDAD